MVPARIRFEILMRTLVGTVGAFDSSHAKLVARWVGAVAGECGPASGSPVSTGQALLANRRSSGDQWWSPAVVRGCFQLSFGDGQQLVSHTLHLVPSTSSGSCRAMTSWTTIGL